MLRSLAANILSARQKSVLRALAYRFGAYKPRQVERLVESVVTLDGARSFLQIGANDGYMSDPLNLAIYTHKITGVLVEPQTNYFGDLKKTYAGFAGMEFVQCAIAEQQGAMTMYTLDCASGRLPRWARGVGTLSREQIQRFGDQIENIDAYIRLNEVECITVAQLLERSQVKRPDIIVVDAESFDYQILSRFDFARISPKLVIYETESMAEGDAARLAQSLVGANFALIDASQDTVAIRRDTTAYQKLVEATRFAPAVGDRFGNSDGVPLITVE